MASQQVRQRWLVSALEAAWIISLSVAVSFTLQPTTSGYTAVITNSTNTAASATWFTCQNAYSFWAPTNLAFGYALSDIASATSATDFSGNAVANTYRGTHGTTASATSCPRDSSTTAYTLNGTTSYLSNNTAVTAPTTYAAMVWFKTTVGQGQILGFGNKANTNSTTHDRQVYLDSTGKLHFYVNPTGGAQYLVSTSAYNDGAWHFLVVQQSAALGMQMYVDNVLVASNAAVGTAGAYSGSWRFGDDVLTGLTAAPASNFFSGQMRFAGVANTTLTAVQISAIYRSGQAN